MASISEQRLKEMEAEMNRFEQEIAPPDGASNGSGGPGGMIIGSNTFNTVEAQLRQIRNETGSFLPPPPPPPSNYTNNSETASEINLPLSALAPPPPPPPEPAPDQQQKQQQQQPPPLLSPPPPPPPLLNRPAFVPPQLRHRPPPPRPPMHHPMGPGPGPGPHGFHGPGPMGQAPYNHPHNMMGPHMGPGPMNHPMMPMQGPMGYHPPQGSFQQPGFPMMGPGGGGEMVDGGAAESGSDANSSPAVIEAKPQVVYSSGPVRTVPKKTKKGKAKPEEATSSAGSSSADFSSMAVMPASYDGESYRGAGAGVQEEPGMAEMEVEHDISVPTKKEKKEKKKKFVRTAASTVWEDPTLAEWDPDDFRMFCGDLGNEVTDETLQRAFSKYPSFVKAKVVRDRRSNKTKGYGFASFKDPIDFTRAMREMNGKYVGNRPIKLRKSTWKDRSIEIVRKKEKEKKRLGLK